MTNNELAYRLALIALIGAVERLCDIGNKRPDRIPAYREAVKLMEVKDVQQGE